MASIVLKRTGQKMPIVGFGLWKVTKSSTADTVYNAIKIGYRLFDGACDYGNEKEAGEGVRRAIKDGLVKRQDLFITTKLWNTFHKHEHVKKLARHQLNDWGLEYFDLYLVHFPISLKYVDPAERYPPEWWDATKKHVTADKVPFSETWKAMEELVDEGLAKNIGVSNMNGSLLNDVLSYARIEPQVLQIELHPYLTQDDMVHYAKDVLGMAITSYSSFGPQGYTELGGGVGVPSLFEQDVIVKVAQQVNKTPAQVILRWLTQRGIAIIPKSNSPHRLEQNLHVTDFNLTEEQIKAISSLNRNLRFNDPKEIDPKFAIFA